MSESTVKGKFLGEQLHKRGGHRHKQLSLTHPAVVNSGEQVTGEQSAIELGRFNGDLRMEGQD